MKKRGFTLVELLAVIAILAILVIIALPNVMGMFNQAKKNSFMTEIKEIYKLAEQTWMSDSMFNTGEKVYSRAKNQNCSKSLDLSGREELEYYIRINKAGKIVEYHATDGTYQYTYEGNELKITDIDDATAIADLGNTPSISITCDGISYSFPDGGGGDPDQGNFYNLNKDKYYDDINDAISDASNHNTIKQLNNVTMAEPIIIPSSLNGLTININGQTLYINYYDGDNIVNDGKIAFIDTASDHGYWFIYEDFVNNGTTTINDNVYIQADNDCIKNNGTLSVLGGILSGSEGDSVINYGTFNMSDGWLGQVWNFKTFTMTGGLLRGYMGLLNESGATANILDNSEVRGTNTCIYNLGTLNMRDSLIKQSYPYSVTGIYNSGVTHITNATINIEMSGTSLSYGIKNMSSGELYFHSGEIQSSTTTNSGDVIGISNEGKIVVENGTINSSGLSTGVGVLNSGDFTMLNGRIHSNSHGIDITNNGIVTLGKNDGTVSITSPLIEVENPSTGIRVPSTGTLNFYDGIIKSKRGSGYAISGNVTNIPSGYRINKVTTSGVESATLVQE